MLYTTYTFLYFLTVVLLLRWTLPRRAVPPMLLLASYVFYLSWGPVYGFLLGGATVATFTVARLIERDRRRRGLWLTLGLVLSLGLLAFFKYAGFLVNQAFSLAALLGAQGAPPALHIVLPLGISFFLFQMISYLVDVWRGEPAETSLLRYALYISFFPQLVAGPIVRGTDLLPQLRGLEDGRGEAARFDPDRFASGVDLLLRGFLKKLVIADGLAAWSDKVFADPTSLGSAALWVGVLAYAGQIYGDFSGYTDIARGAGRMLGFELPENFRLPYLSTSITEFWRRWHITLSTWLRDYLYIPLGGNRKGRRRRYVNLLTTMALGGLWHGASWTFVIWGVYHGLLLALHKAWVALTTRSVLGRWRDTLVWKLGAALSTFSLVLLGWVVFRAPSTHVAGEVISGLFTGRVASGLAAHAAAPSEMVRAMWLLAALAAGHALGAAPWPGRLWRRLHAVPRGLAWAGVALSCYLLAGRPAEFIYFQF